MDEAVIKHVRDAEKALRNASVSLGKAERSLKAASEEEDRKRLALLGHEALDVALRVDAEAGILQRKHDVAKP